VTQTATRSLGRRNWQWSQRSRQAGIGGRECVR
jgi:hypothetical protein